MLPFINNFASDEIYSILEGNIEIHGKKAVEKAILNNVKDKALILYGDYHPVDAVIHIPILCEDRNIPVLYIKEPINDITIALVDLNLLKNKKFL